MDIADKKRDRDRDRAATGLGGNFSAALVSRYLLAVFAAFVLADAAISTTLPRYAHARREESSDGPAQRRCQFGTQARIADLPSDVRPHPVPVPVPDALMRWSRALTVRVTWLRSPTSSKPWASTSLSRPVPGTCAPTSLAATRNRLQSNSLTAVTLDEAVAVWSASCTATGASRRSAVACCVSRRWFADLHPQLWAMVRMSGTAAGCYLAYRSHMTSPVRSPGAVRHPAHALMRVYAEAVQRVAVRVAVLVRHHATAEPLAEACQDACIRVPCPPRPDPHDRPVFERSVDRTLVDNFCKLAHATLESEPESPGSKRYKSVTWCMTDRFLLMHSWTNGAAAATALRSRGRVRLRLCAVCARHLPPYAVSFGLAL